MLVEHAPFMGSLEAVIAECQYRQAPQLAAVLEQDGVLQVTSEDRLAGASARPLNIVASPAGPKSRRRQIDGANANTGAQTPDGAAAMFDHLVSTSPAARSPGTAGTRPYSLLMSPDLAGGARVSAQARQDAEVAAVPRRERTDTNPDRPRSRPVSQMSLGAPPGAGAARTTAATLLRNKGGAEPPRCIITAKSSRDDVSFWLVSIGLARLVGKFYKKKVDGNKLFLMTERQFRKLIKAEDDFVLFKRALRQAVAYALTTPDSCQGEGTL